MFNQKIQINISTKIIESLFKKHPLLQHLFLFINRRIKVSIYLHLLNSLENVVWISAVALGTGGDENCPKKGCVEWFTSEGALPWRRTFSCENEALVCPAMSWHCPYQNRWALILSHGKVWGLSPLGWWTRLQNAKYFNFNVRLSCNFVQLRR